MHNQHSHARDPGCTRPSCTAPGYHSQVHHAVADWKNNGQTNVNDLTLACGPDNRMVENTGWTTRKRPDGRTEWIPPPTPTGGTTRLRGTAKEESTTTTTPSDTSSPKTTKIRDDMSTLQGVNSMVPALIAAGGLASACVLAAPAGAAPVSYGSNGVFGVSTQPREGWATTYIPPGRYRVDQSPSMQPYQSPPGFWLKCSNFPCGGTFPGNIIATGEALRDAPTFVDILPSDVAIALHNVTLTVA